MTSPTSDRRQGLVGNTPFKAPCDLATTAAIALSGEQVIDGVLTASSRVLVKDQADATTNGIYTSSSAAWTRSPDADGTYDIAQGTMVFVTGGGANANSLFNITTPLPVVGSTAIAWRVLTSIINFASSIGASLVGVIQAGAGAVLMTVQSWLRERVSVTQFGGVMNDSSAGARTANSAAILAALVAKKGLNIPEGTLWINPLTLTGFWDIKGAGAEATIIKGDGDLFSLTAVDNGEMRRFNKLKLMNDVTKGKLFKSTGTTNRVQFDQCNFDNANYHIYSSGGDAVSWKIADCRFINHAIESRHFEGLWVYREEGCYTWYGRIGLRCTNGAVSSCTISGSTFEQMDDSAIVLDASNVSYEVSAFTIKAHFEANGKLTNAADVVVSTNAATRARAVRMLGCGFFTPTATQTTRVNVSAGGGGNIDLIEVDGGSLMGIVPLCPDTTAMKVRNVYFQSLSPRPTNMVPVQAQYQYSLRYLGHDRVVGSEVGSSATTATLTAPVGVRDWRVTVSGDRYNGVPNSNTALNVTYMSGTTANTRALTDVNHSVGANQGFIVTYNAGTRVITVANKAALTATQSGEVFAEYFA